MGSMVRAWRSVACLVALGLGSGCGKDAGQLGVFPSALDYGEVDFLDEMPEEGYASTELRLTNSGEVPLALTLATLDLDHLCAPGFGSVPADLVELEPEESYSLFIGVCAYSAEGGERDSEVRGQIVIESDDLDGPVSVPWSFTPVLGLGDTGALP